MYVGQGTGERKDGPADAGGPGEGRGSGAARLGRGTPGGRSVSQERHRGRHHQVGLPGQRRRHARVRRGLRERAEPYALCRAGVLVDEAR